jgi:hypothetical protein
VPIGGVQITVGLRVLFGADGNVPRNVDLGDGCGVIFSARCVLQTLQAEIAAAVILQSILCGPFAYSAAPLIPTRGGSFVCRIAQGIFGGKPFNEIITVKLSKLSFAAVSLPSLVVGSCLPCGENPVSLGHSPSAAGSRQTDVFEAECEIVRRRQPRDCQPLKALQMSPCREHEPSAIRS